MTSNRGMIIILKGYIRELLNMMTEDEKKTDVGRKAVLAGNVIRFTGDVDFGELSIISDCMHILFNFDHLFGNDDIPGQIVKCWRCCNEILRDVPVTYIPAGMSVEVMNLDMFDEPLSDILDIETWTESHD